MSERWNKYSKQHSIPWHADQELRTKLNELHLTRIQATDTGFAQLQDLPLTDQQHDLLLDGLAQRRL